MPQSTRQDAGSAPVVAIFALGCCALFLTLSRPAAPRIEASSTQAQTIAGMSDEERLARATCSTCHKFPPPDVLPKDAWRSEIVRMMFIGEGRLPPIGDPAVVYRNVQLPPDMQQVLQYMVKNAPDHLAAPERWPDPSESPIKFTHYGLSVPDMPNDPAVSNVELVDFDGDGTLDVLATEMRQGTVVTGHPQKAGSPLSVVASIPHPAHVAFTDFDGDGRKVMLIADLGQFLPGDHHDGAVIWLRALATGKFSPFWLDGWPRVADVEAADFNGDGKADLAVAAFGWRKTGQIAILENQTTNPAQPLFVTHVIDPRPGGIHIIPVDLNHDGRMDFVTLLAQQDETVLAYINKGNFSFEQKVVYAAPHPNWGSSGIQLVDLDKDGDLDVILTHGDSFDDGFVKPYHGIQWLENTGTYPFVEHTITAMPGVHRALAADIDGDGDLDIVACALLAGGSDQDESVLPALVWLEQAKPGVFVKHTIDLGFPRHATLDVADIDGDGDMDIVTGYFSINKPAESWVQVWLNQSKSPAKEVRLQR